MTSHLFTSDEATEIVQRNPALEELIAFSSIQGKCMLPLETCPQCLCADMECYMRL